MKRKIACFMLIIFMSFNIYELDLSTRKVNINQPAHAIEPLTAYFISSAIAGLALSLGYQLVNSTSDSFTQGCMTLYNNFTTNTKNLIDRIAGKKQAGDSTYDVTPVELESFGNELSSLINNGSSSGEITTFSFPDYNFTNEEYSYEGYTIEYDDMGLNQLWLSYGLKRNIDYLNYRIYYDGNIIVDQGYMRFYYGSNNLDWWRLYDNIKQKEVSQSSGVPSYNIPKMKYNEYGGDYYYVFNYGNHNFTNVGDSNYRYPNPSLFSVEVGYDLVQEPPVITVGQMNISELIAALQSSGALNGQGAVTQQFITNYDTAVPADIYTDINAKTVVDSLFDGADTNVPDVPQDWGILQSMYQVLQNIYSSVKTGFSNVYSKVASISTSISDIFAYDPALTVDLSGFNNLVIKEKFPFSIPFDLYNAIKLFSASAAEPQFVVSIHNKFIDIEHEIDISILSTFIVFFRWVACVWFTIFLITKTRDMIKW